MKHVVPRCLLYLVLVAVPAVAQETIDADRTFNLDVVELLNGTEVAGNPEHAIDHQGFRYQFASRQNLAKFRSAPDKYKVALDGGCGRMGSLSGRGSTRWWTVHAGRVYVFASEGCRTGFLESPDDMLERDDQPPQFEPKPMELGLATLQQVITSMGGAERIDAIQQYTESMSDVVTSGETRYDHQTTTTIDFTQRSMRLDDSWNRETYSQVFQGNRSFFEHSDQRRPMYENARAECRRAMNRHLLTVLKSRERPDFQVALLPGNPEPTSDSRKLVVHFDGTTVELDIEPTVHLVQSLSYRGRVSGSRYGRVTRKLDKYQPVNGVMLPHMQSVYFQNSETPESKRTYQITVK